MLAAETQAVRLQRGSGGMRPQAGLPLTGRGVTRGSCTEEDIDARHETSSALPTRSLQHILGATVWVLEDQALIPRLPVFTSSQLFELL